MNKDLITVVSGFLLAVVLLAALPACGGVTAGATTPIPTVPQPTATALLTATSTPTPTATATATATVAPVATSPAGPSNSDLLAQGKLIFEKTAGGVGCAACHGMDGKGSKTVGAPDNRGAAEARVRAALAGGVAMMGFIKLTDDEITAVVAYLQYLATLP